VEVQVAVQSEELVTVAPPTQRWVRVRRVAVPIARVVFTLAIVAAVIYATVSQWSDVQSYLSSLSWSSVALSGLMVMVATLTATMGWRAALRNFGDQVPVRTAGQIYLVGILAKYLPGSVWAFVLQMELGKRANLPRIRPFLASLTLTGYGAVSGLLFGLFAIPAVSQVSGALVVVVIILAPIALICAQPAVLSWLLRRATKLVRRPAEFPTLTYRGMAPVAGWAIATTVTLGLHLWLLSGLSATGGEGYMRSVGAIGLGMTLGMVAFLAPSGLGVREALIVAALAPYMSAGAALGLALTSRLLLTLGDVLAAVIAGSTALPAIRLALSRSRTVSAAQPSSAE
jgi:hypothetical protein